jgi:hypothetical protein
LGTGFAVIGSGAGIYYSVADMAAQASKWGVFAGKKFSILPVFFLGVFFFFFVSLTFFSSIFTSIKNNDVATECYQCVPPPKVG